MLSEDHEERTTWKYAHAACFMRNCTDGAATRPSTQSMGYFDCPGYLLPGAWSQIPLLQLSSDEYYGVLAAQTALLPTDDPDLNTALPTPALRTRLAAAVAVALPGTDVLDPAERLIAEWFCFRQRLTPRSMALLDASERAENQPEDHADPLKGKFTQYSPNSKAHCRDCQSLLAEGHVRIGANVFSSSARHASYSVNYWCLECMCLRPSVTRLARITGDLERVLPGAGLLSEPDVFRVCTLLKLPPPSETQRAALATGRVRATRSGRQFNTWGGDEEEKEPTSSKRARRTVV